MTSIARSRCAVLAAAEQALRTTDPVSPQGGADEDDWRLSPPALAFLRALVAQLRPSAVFELGSGVSTVALASALAEVDAALVSLEHDPEHLASTRAALAEAGLVDRVRLVAAPVVARRRNGHYVPEYHVEPGVLPDRCAWADIVLVDGPPLPLGGREGGLSQALEAARSGAVVVLDDARRESERELLVQALLCHEPRIEAMNLLGFPKGLAVILVASDGEPEEGR